MFGASSELASVMEFGFKALTERKQNNVQATIRRRHAIFGEINAVEDGLILCQHETHRQSS